ncbi:hypothetical protein Dda_1541 [Drechslerella dactyloides]|uniref:Uncharacterized protein n=1 Tax=Drechslerella dactyloides TaxID=74499 RepID=A0AAD6J1Z2_DREDA|nr:hypothetical protein Dda_1541 [Drechslerella dactyloides]
MCHITHCPNELLIEIFSFFDNDCRTGYEPKHYADGDPSKQVFTVLDPNEKPPPRPSYCLQETAGKLDRDRAVLFDLRRVCRRFNTVVTPIAFTKVRLDFCLEHTALLVRNLGDEKNITLASYVRHVSITPRSYVSRSWTAENGALEPLDARTQSGLPFIHALQELFANLPPNITELTIRDLDKDSPQDFQKSTIQRLNKTFFVDISQAAARSPTSQFQKINIHTCDIYNAEGLWSNVYQDEVTLSRRYHGIIRPNYKSPTFAAGAEEINIFSEYSTFYTMQAAFQHFPSTIKHLTLLSPYQYYKHHGQYDLGCAEKLHSLVLGSCDVRNAKFLQLVARLVNVSKFYIYNCDISGPFSTLGFSPIELVGHVAPEFGWSQVFNAAMGLEKLVDFQAGNISYQFVRKSYKYLDVKGLWMFTPYEEDFDSFRDLQQCLVARGGNVDNTNMSKAYYLDESSELQGITLRVIENDLRFSHLATKKTEEDCKIEEHRTRLWQYAPAPDAMMNPCSNRDPDTWCSHRGGKK